MKKLLLLFILFLFSCQNKEKENTDTVPSKSDDILEISQKHIDTAVAVYHNSDSASKEKVIKIVKEIKYLNNAVENYKETLNKQTIATERIIYKVDTVYIETKRNFWGKEKTNIKIVSDSTIKESIDSISKQKIDSL